MKNKFICKDCHHHFEGDDGKATQCPKCGSDNIDYDKPTGKRFWWVALLAIAITAIAIGPWPGVQTSCSNNSDTCIVKRHTCDSIAVYVPAKVNIVGGTPQFNDASNNYSFKVEVVDAPEADYYVAVTEKGNHTNVIAQADRNNLSFENVPPSDDEGEYDLVVFVVGSRQEAGFSTRSGFKKVEPQTERLSQKTLQDYIDRGDAILAGDMPQIAPGYQLHYNNLPDTEKNLPQTLLDLSERLESWSSAKITKVKYNELNQITDIYIDVEK